MVFATLSVLMPVISISFVPTVVPAIILISFMAMFLPAVIAVIAFTTAIPVVISMIHIARVSAVIAYDHRAPLAVHGAVTVSGLA